MVTCSMIAHFCAFLLYFLLVRFKSTFAKQTDENSVIFIPIVLHTQIAINIAVNRKL